MRNKHFENWFAKYNDIHPSDVADMFDGDTYTSRKYYVEIAWAAWCNALGFMKD
jgi:hypothetical protein